MEHKLKPVIYLQTTNANGQGTEMTHVPYSLQTLSLFGRGLFLVKEVVKKN